MGLIAHCSLARLDKKRERQIEDMYKLRRKSVAFWQNISLLKGLQQSAPKAAAGEVLNFFRAQREMQMTMALVLVVWLEAPRETL